MKDVHVTLADVAAQAGVSTATASRALAGLGVNKANLAAVEKAAAELGYIPNEAARSLRVVRTMTVGMVFHQLTSRLGVELLGALTSGLDTMGYSLFVSTAQGEADRYDQLVHRFLERRVDALICVHGRGDGAALDRYLSAGIPALALISQGGGYERLPLIAPGAAEAARACLDELTAQGHRQVCIVRPHGAVGLMGDIIAAARDSSLTLRELACPPQGLDAAAFAADLRKPDGPTAVIALQGEAVRILRAAEAAGLAVPADISLVAIRDRSLFMETTSVPLATIHVDPSLVATAATVALRRWLDDKVPLVGQTKVSAATWRSAASVGPAPDR